MNAISETEHVRLAQRFACEPLKRMGVLGFPASGQRTWPACNPASQGTDSRLCGAKTPACGGKHADEITLRGIDLKGNALVSDPVLPRAKGSLSSAPRLADTSLLSIIHQNHLTN